VWSQPGSKFVGTGAVGQAIQGYSVSLSADGNTAILGGYYDNSSAGAAWVFIRSASAVGDETGETPQQFCLEQNYPNPFNPSTTIRYGLPHRAFVTLAVYNTLGQEIALLAEGEQEAGYHEVKFDGSTLGSGVYFCRLKAGGFVATRKALVLR
jgi:hypothetical protein